MGLPEQFRLAINSAATDMQIGFEFEMECGCPGPTPVIPALRHMLIAGGSDACDLALAGSLGPNTPERFEDWTDEVAGP